MTTPLQHAVLRANAVYLLFAATAGMISDLNGIFMGRGPLASVVAAAPHAGIGFVEAHGLALIIGAMLWLAEPSRLWHVAAAVVHALLGTANLSFWNVFVAADMLAVGYVTTSLHGLFAVLQLVAALNRSPTSSTRRTA